mmetsp:Transcript_34668/g.72936  ORF Transcript_34668/g.72936 Transcript_34668/m.72936 type:complete len:218 (-) Transcript_34668:198-851(-)
MCWMSKSCLNPPQLLWMVEKWASFLFVQQMRMRPPTLLKMWPMAFSILTGPESFMRIRLRKRSWQNFSLHSMLNFLAAQLQSVRGRRPNQRFFRGTLPESALSRRSFRGTLPKSALSPILARARRRAASCTPRAFRTRPPTRTATRTATRPLASPRTGSTHPSPRGPTPTRRRRPTPPTARRASATRPWTPTPPRRRCRSPSAGVSPRSRPTTRAAR